MQQVLINMLRDTWHIVDVSNHKFDEMILILEDLFAHLKSQAPTTVAYDTLTLQINTGLQKVFDKFSELKESLLLAPLSRATDAREEKAQAEHGNLPWISHSGMKMTVMMMT